MSGLKLSASADGVNFEELTEVVEIPQLKEYILKWIPNSNPNYIGCYQLVDMNTEQVIVEGHADPLADFIKSQGLTSKCGWIWS